MPNNTNMTNDAKNNLEVLQKQTLLRIAYVFIHQPSHGLAFVELHNKVGDTTEITPEQKEQINSILKLIDLSAKTEDDPENLRKLNSFLQKNKLSHFPKNTFFEVLKWAWASEQVQKLSDANDKLKAHQEKHRKHPKLKPKR